jgi:hypothetical protein
LLPYRAEVIRSFILSHEYHLQSVRELHRSSSKGTLYRYP